jgi:exopolyphosphatase/guanosine-5'-triphosphate,3'-diphosphate pyrophosphatase
VSIHVDVGDHEIVVVLDDRRVALPIGVVSLSSDLATDPPRPEELTNAIGLVADHLDDIVRDRPDLVGADLSMAGPEVTAMVAVELGGTAVLPFALGRAAAEDVFRTLVTERRADRVHNPGLDVLLVDRVVAGSCAVVAVMRTLQLDSVMVRP